MNLEEEINELNRNHEPSFSRGLVRLAKNSRSEEEISILVDEARTMKEPYQKANCLASLALEMDKKGLIGVEDLFGEACREVLEVKQDWRKAEVLDWVSSKISKSSFNDHSGVIKALETLMGYKDLKELSRNIAKHIKETKDLIGLVELSKDNDQRLEMIRICANEMMKRDPLAIKDLEEHAELVLDPFLRSKAYGYLGLKAKGVDRELSAKYFKHALKVSKDVTSDKQRLQLLNYLSDNISTAKTISLEDMEEAAQGFKDEYLKARFLGHLAGTMSRTKNERSIDIFDQALVTCSEINDPQDKTKALMTVGKGLKKSGLKKYNVAMQLAMECATEVKGEAGEELLKKVREEIGEPKGLEDSDPEDFPQLERNRILTLGLFNTYEKKIGSAHIRAISRAAPLCWAYDLDLAIINFPIKDEEDLKKLVLDDTAIGKGGKYLKRLVRTGRVHIQEEYDDSKLGTAVATTSHPDKNKKVEMGELSEGVSDILFLLGVGKRGLPGSILARADHHMEFTGKGIPLETCTAMGILAHLIGELDGGEDQ